MSAWRLWVAGAAVSAMLGACAFSFYSGYQRGREQVMRAAVHGYQLRERTDEKAGFLFGVDLCVANGGLRRECINDVRRLETSAKGE